MGSTWMWLALVGCGKVHEGRPAEETAAEGEEVDSDTDEGVTGASGDSGGDTAGGTDTGAAATTTDTGAPPACAQVLTFPGYGLTDAWRSPSGALYTTGGPERQVRDPAGSWAPDPGDPPFAWRVDGFDDTEVWSITGDRISRREPGGWAVAYRAPVDSLVALAVSGPGDATFLGVADEDGTDVLCDFYDTAHDTAAYRCDPDVTVLVRWDGTSFTQEAGDVFEHVDDMAVLPDHRVVLAADGAVHRWEGGRVPAPEGDYRGVEAGLDGTLVAWGSALAVGDASGLGAAGPGAPHGVVAAWVGGATDLWVSSVRWEDGVNPFATLTHFDGSAWTPVLVDFPAAPLRLTGGGGQVFAVGVSGWELVLAGGTGGFAIDRERFGVIHPRLATVDDRTGEVWLSGYNEVLGRWNGTGFDGVLLALAGDPDDLEATGSRVVMVTSDHLHVWDGVTLRTTDVRQAYGPRARLWRVAAGGGALFAVGEDDDDALLIVRDAGSGWERVDTTGLKADRFAAAMADGPDDLWLGASWARGSGSLWHWDGANWEEVVTGLGDEPEWIDRLSDGALYFTSDGPLWRWDGVAASPVPDLPAEVRAAILTPRGDWYVTTVEDRGDMVGVLWHRGPADPAFAVIAETEGVWTPVGAGEAVWAIGDGQVWTNTGCTP